MSNKKNMSFDELLAKAKARKKHEKEIREVAEYLVAMEDEDNSNFIELSNGGGILIRYK